METKQQSWKQYFEEHPEFAALSPRLWSPEARGNTIIMRMYLGDDFLQRKIVERQRSANSYYNAHRMSKGDDFEVVSDETTWSGDDATRDHLLTISDSSGLPDLWQKFVALRNQPKRKRPARRAA